MTKDHKKSWLDTSKYLLSTYGDNTKEFMRRVVTKDETGPSLWSWCQIAEYAIEAPWLTSPKKFKSFFSRKGHHFDPEVK